MHLKCKIDNYIQDWTQHEDLPVVPMFEKSLLENSSSDNHVYERIDGHTYRKTLCVLEGDILFKVARKLWREIEDVIVSETYSSNYEIQRIAKEIINLFLNYYHCVQSAKQTVNERKLISKLFQYLEVFKKCMLPWGELEDTSVNKLLCFSNVSQADEHISEYFHCYLNINLLMLLMYLKCDCDSSNKTEVMVECIMKDLTLISYKIYQRHIKSEDVLHIQPFSCYCTKKFWWFLSRNLLVQEGNNDRFWKLYNSMTCTDDNEFNLWFLCHIVLLQGYNVSGVYIEPNLINFSDSQQLTQKYLQQILSSNICDNKMLLNVLRILHPLLTNVWMRSAKLEPYLHLWEYFYKNFDGSSLRDIVIPKTCKDFQEKISCLKNNASAVTNSYEYFISMLYKHMRVHSSHWQKFKGRVYSKLHPDKMKDFDDKVLYHISLLFLMLIQVGTTEVIEKLQFLLESMPKERHYNELFWIIYITMLITCIYENMDIKIPALPLLNLLQAMSEKRDHYFLIKHYIAGIEVIINVNDNFKLGQSILFGPWIIKYMNSCSQADLCYLISTLMWTIERVKSNGCWNDFKANYSSNVLPGLKQIATQTNVFPQTGKLAAAICLSTPELQSSTIQHFCGDQINVKVTNQFLNKLLQDYPVIQNFPSSKEHVLIQAWVKCCLLSNELNNEELSKKIFNLETIETILHINEDQIQNPLEVFIKALQKQMSLQSNFYRLKELCEISFGDMDGWLRLYLNHSPSHSSVLNVYMQTSLLFYHCPLLLYHKTKSSCLLNRLVSILLLPTEVLMGKSPHANILSAIEQTWHLFVQGVFSLDYTSDAYVERTLKDLVVRYLPHFSTVNSPIRKILDNRNLASFILEKIANSFLLRSARSLDENTFKAIKTIQNIIEHTEDKDVIKLIVQRTLLGILEVIMFNSQKSAAIDFMKYITASEIYIHMRDEVRQSVQIVGEKHLAFSASTYFQMIGVLVKLIPNDVRACLPQIKKQILNVERMRGVGFDNTLRQGLDRIENALSF